MHLFCVRKCDLHRARTGAALHNSKTWNFPVKIPKRNAAGWIRHMPRNWSRVSWGRTWNNYHYQGRRGGTQVRVRTSEPPGFRRFQFKILVPQIIPKLSQNYPNIIPKSSQNHPVYRVYGPGRARARPGPGTVVRSSFFFETTFFEKGHFLKKCYFLWLSWCFH